ncbi:MAG: hypothetical protein J5780_02545 [Treponema sp.]|nr:hypothetical protein [Treponema sp.]
MKKILFTALLALFTVSAVLAQGAKTDSAFKPKGRVSSYTQTDYSVTLKFGDPYRTVTAKNVHIFGADGLEQEINSYNSKNELLSKATFIYDVSRNLTEISIADASGALLTRTAFEYNTDGTVKSESEYNSAAKLCGKTIYKYEGTKKTESYYDGNGALLSRIITVMEGNLPVEVADYYGDGSLSNKEVFSYDTNGRLNQTTVYKEDGTVSSKKIYRYDANGVITELRTYDPQDVLIQRDVYKSDSNGNPVRISVYEISNKFGGTSNELLTITDFQYKY